MHSLADASGYMSLSNKCTAIAQAGVLPANSCRRTADDRRCLHPKRGCRLLRNPAARQLMQAPSFAHFVEALLERNCPK